MSAPTEHPRTTLRSITDFHDVPDEKLQHCVEDFLLWLRMVRYMKRHFGDLSGFAMVTPLDAFTWVDDGKHDANFRVELLPSVDSVNFDVVEKGGQR